MSNFKNLIELELIEEFASTHGLVESEEDLSERFDKEVAEGVVEIYGEDDEPAMMEAFSNFVDGLEKDGQIHEVQVNSYCYVGKYAKDD